MINQKSKYKKEIHPITSMEQNKYELENDAFFIVEPGASLELNITKNVRLGVGASYRLVYGLELDDIKSDAFDDWALDFTLKVGKF